MWLIVLILVGLLIWLSVHQNKIVGKLGEKHLQSVLSGIKGEQFPDIYIKDQYGVAQVDLVLICKKGILIFEKKTMIGLILPFTERQWFQCVGGGKKYKFKNPLNQNYGHIKAVQGLIPEYKAFTRGIVVFGNNAKLSDNIPDGVVLESDLNRYIDMLPDRLIDTQILEASRMMRLRIRNQQELKSEHRKKLRY